jgi:hypothetical protein
VTEKNHPFQLANAGKTKPVELEHVAAEPNGDLTTLLQASLQKVEQSRPTRVLRRSAGENHNEKPSKIKKRKSALTLSEAPKKGTAPFNPGVKGAFSSDVQDPDNAMNMVSRSRS